MNQELYQEELQAELILINSAIKDALGAKKYKLDTGQSVQEVERQSLETLYSRKDHIINELTSNSGRYCMSAG